MNKDTLRLILVGAGAAAVVLWFLRRQASAAVDALGNVGSDIGLGLSDLLDNRTIDDLTGDINCDHFNRASVRGEALYQRCIRGELPGQ